MPEPMTSGTHDHDGRPYAHEPTPVDLVAALRNGADALDSDASQDAADPRPRKQQRGLATRAEADALRAFANDVEKWRTSLSPDDLRPIGLLLYGRGA